MALNSASKMLELQVCATTPGFKDFLEFEMPVSKLLLCVYFLLLQALVSMVPYYEKQASFSLVSPMLWCLEGATQLSSMCIPSL